MRGFEGDKNFEDILSFREGTEKRSTMLAIHTLGSLSIHIGGQELRELGSRKAEAILVYLGMEGGNHSRNSLAAIFWPNSSESKALTSLRVALSLLRNKVQAR